MTMLSVRNVNEAWTRFILSLSVAHEQNWRTIAPRTGKVTKEWRAPVTIHYSKPFERVLFCPVRDANPYFHFMESLWMMDGRKDLKSISEFSSNIAQFSDDGHTLNGAYGFRWRYHYGEDQLLEIAAMLNREPDTRRAVLTMWDPIFDLNSGSLDIPCNTHVYFKIREGKLHMSVCNRSNDIVWGCLGANAVHFSVLHEWMATATNTQVGAYTHFADSWHYYVENPTVKKLNMANLEEVASNAGDYYSVGQGTFSKVTPVGLVHGNAKRWLKDLDNFMLEDNENLTDFFFRKIAAPLRDSWREWKKGDRPNAMLKAKQIAAPDWRIACINWLRRRNGQ